MHETNGKAVQGVEGCPIIQKTEIGRKTQLRSEYNSGFCFPGSVRRAELTITRSSESTPQPDDKVNDS